VDAHTLQQRLSDGWTIQTTRLSEGFDMDRLKEKLGEPGENWLLIGSISPDGKFRMYSQEHAFKPEADFRLLYFAPE